MKSLLRHASALRDHLEPLWPAGLAVLLLHLGKRFFPFRGEPYEWAQYLALGTVYPGLLLAAGLARRPAWCPEAAVRTLKAALALACLWPLKLLFKGPAGIVLLLLGAALALVALGAVSLARGRPSSLPGGLSGRVFGGALVALCWFLAARWLWWKPVGEWAGSASMIAVVAGSFALSGRCFTRFLTPGDEAPVPPWGRALGGMTVAFALAVLLLASVRVNGSGMNNTESNAFGHFAHHHWGAVVGPAHFVRQGAWLLWDAPSQYGFLNTLVVAGLPFDDVWQSGYAFNAFLLFLSSSFLFLLLRAVDPGPLNGAFALLLTLAAVFLLPGWPQAVTGPYLTPAVGPFRFFWCYALVAVLLWEHRGAERGRAGAAPLWVGCGAWLLGSLWSAESAVYSAVVWLPAFLVMLLRRARAWHPEGRRRERALVVARWLALPPLLLALAAALVHAVYVARLGHGPDWSMYVEYVRGMGVFALPVERRGTVWVLLLVFAAVATAALHVLRGEHALRDLPPLLGAGGALWAASSYYVGRSHEVNANNLSPFVVLAAAATLYVLARRREVSAWAAWVRLGLLPVMTVMLVAAFWNVEALRGYARDAARGYEARVARLLPTADPALEELLAEGGVGPDTPLLAHDNRPAWMHGAPAWEADDGAGGRRLVAESPAWVPGGPLTVYVPLPPDRRCLYFARFAARIRRDGWLLEPDEPPAAPVGWLREQLGRSHVRGRTLVKGGWRLTRYEHRDNAAVASQ